MTRRATTPHRPRFIVPAAAGLPRLDAAAVWILGALRHLLRRGRSTQRNAWEWVDVFDDLLDQMKLIRDDEEPPANRCPLVPVRMPAEVDVWPEPGEALPLEYEERLLGAIDNRRLVGKVAQVLINHIALQRQAAIRYREQAQRDDCPETQEKANGYAIEVRDRGRKALRGVDLEELSCAVEVESRPVPTAPPSTAEESIRSSELEIQFMNDRLAIVSEARTTVEVRGKRQVWLFRSVVDAAGQTVSWTDLLHADIGASSQELERRLTTELQRRRRREEDGDSAGSPVEPVTPRHALREDTLQRTGNRVQKALGKLTYHWHQDGHGARWDAKVS